MTRSQTQNNDCDIEMPRQDLTGEGSNHFISPVKVCDPINIPECEPLNNRHMYSTPSISTHIEDSSVQ